MIKNQHFSHFFEVWSLESNLMLPLLGKPHKAVFGWLLFAIPVASLFPKLS